MPKNLNSKQYDLEDRTLEFAKKVRSFVKLLPKTSANLEDSKQLVRASGSVVVESIGFQRLDRRLAAALLGKGAKVSASHQEIAEQLGVSRESVSRLLKQFEQSGCVHLGRGAIEIADPSALRRIAAGEAMVGGDRSH